MLSTSQAIKLNFIHLPQDRGFPLTLLTLCQVYYTTIVGMAKMIGMMCKV